MALSPRSWKDDATLLCIMLPPSQGSKLFGRDDVIDKVEDHFNRPGSEPFRSVALYGMGGVGKTTVATKYAEKQNARRSVNAVLWVVGQSEMKIKQSFTQIAQRLQLPNFAPQSHDDNRLLVMNWLQQTKAKWLIVYDNVEDFDVLHAHWPSSTARGHALITTRNTALAYEPAEAGIEVSSWDTRTGSQFLLHLLSGHISAELLASQSQSALELSERLSGHALALAKMGGVIHRRSWTIRELVEVYDRQPDFKNGIGPVCPDSITQSSPEPKELKHLPASLQWLGDREKLSQAIEELQTLSLVKKDRESRTLSIHRLIQSHFLEFLGNSGRQEALDLVSRLPYLAFPQRQAYLHNKWDICTLFVQQIVALKDGFRAERKRGVNLKACRELCEVAVTCSRFLLEQQELTEMEDMCIVAKDALSTRDDGKLVDIESTLQSYLGQMYLRCGWPKKALVCLLESLRIWLLDRDGDLQEVSWSEHNVAQAYLANGELEAGYEWHQKCRKTWDQWGKLQPDTVDVTFDLSMQASMARCLLYMGQATEPRRLLEQPLKKLLEPISDNWAEAAYATFLLGGIKMADKNFPGAEVRFMEAQMLWGKGDKARTSHFNGATMYRMGCCALEDGRVETAVKYFMDAMAVTYIHKEHMVGEHARCLYKLSQALHQLGGRELEADNMLQDAEGLYFTRSENQGKAPTEEDYDRLVYVLWR
ncbi:P-loop containing nucleoside triphosphate hydrolase protein [Phaeosphaeriaceae sp. PMI808]|nr:P-loop containing nucleoside triphosphate hydrolase protein [Phaeosphaeriaceae sp. PMI808]